MGKPALSGGTEVGKMSRDIPVIFSGPMVNAKLAKVKTMTRRMAWLPPRRSKSGKIADAYQRQSPWQTVEPGDRLWVRETARAEELENGSDGVRYMAGGEWISIENTKDAADEWVKMHNYRGTREAWVPSIHMPRWASRLTLVITDTKVERLQDMSDADAKAEGVVAFKSGATSMFGIAVDGGYSHPGLRPQETFMNLWCDLHGPVAWKDNPEVVAMSFIVHRCNIDRMP